MSIEKGMVVAIEYELKEDGQDEVLDSNRGGEPLEFILGNGSIISGLESEIEKMKSGDEAKVKVLPEDAYGKYDPTGLVKTPIEQFAGVDLEIGLSLYGQAEDGRSVQVTVKEFDDKEVTIDYNHPLADKTLVFDMKILTVRTATKEETAQGYPGAAAGGCGCGDGSCDS